MEFSTNHLKTYVVDRYEGAYAVLLDSYGKAFDVLRDELPKDVREGDILNEKEGIYVYDEEQTAKKRAKLQRLSDALTKENESN